MKDAKVGASAAGTGSVSDWDCSERKAVFEFDAVCSSGNLLAF